MSPGHSEVESRRLRWVPLSRQIAQALREDIYFGRIKPGTHLAQQQLCEQFGTSRMPVRDALREMVRDGLLIQDETRHTVVAPLSRSDLLDGFLIEGTLNGIGARRATANVTPEGMATLTALHQEMLAAGKQGELERMAQLNWQFHRLINRMAESPKLLAALRTVSLDVPRDFLAQVPSWMNRSNREHAAILKAMKAGDGERADRLMVAHIAASGEGLVHYLQSKGLDLG